MEHAHEHQTFVARDSQGTRHSWFLPTSSPYKLRMRSDRTPAPRASPPSPCEARPGLTPLDAHPRVFRPMRPIHGLLALAVVALLLIGGLLYWTSADSTPTTEVDGGRRPVADSTKGPMEDLAAVPKDVRDRTAQAGTDGSAPGRVETPTGEGKAQRVSGRVVDEAGKGIANAVVYAASGGGMDEIALDEVDPTEMFWFQRVETKTDSSGRFALDPKINAKVRLAVRASGFAPLDVDRTISETRPDVGDLVVQGGVVVEGRVIDHLGRPVAGAELRRRRPSGGPMSFFMGRGGAVAAKSDAQGNFRVDTMPVGTWNLRVTSEIAPDKDESGETVRAGEVVRGIQIQLEEGFEIAGLVSGVPAIDAGKLRIAAVPRGNDFGGDFGPAMGGGQRLAPIAADGSFVLKGCKKDAKYRVSARLASQGLGGMLRSPTRSATVDATAGDRGLEIPYRAETALTFQVVDGSTGAPITTMSVSAGARWPAPLTDDKNRSIHEFPGGKVRYGGLRLGGGPMGRGGANEPLTVRVESAGYAPWERKDVRVTEGIDNDLGVIRLEKTSLVKVRVTSASNGAPVVGARVSIDAEEKSGGPMGGRTFSIRAGGGDDEDALDFGGGAAHRGRTNDEGIARVSSIPGSKARISVSHRDYADFRSEVLDLPTGSDFERDVVITAGGTIVVKVVDAAGNPVRDEPLEHRNPDDEADAPMFFGPNGPLATDAEGRTTLTKQTPGIHSFRLQGSGGPRMFGSGGMRMAMARSVNGGEEAPEEPWTEVSVTEGGTHEVVLQAPERARVVGRVKEGGRALAGATVRLRAKDGDDMPFFDEGTKAETDGSGEYALENVTVGEYTISVTHPSRAMAHESELRVGSGETRENVDLPLSILEGRVTNEEGKGVSGLRIRAEKQSGGDGVVREFVIAMDTGDGPVSFGGGGGGQVTTDSDGRYKLRGVLADTDLAVVATGQGIQRQQSEVVRVPADSTRSGIDLVVSQGASLEVSCRRQDGTPATPCEVRAEFQGEGDTDAKFEITRGDGKARFQGLKPGSWRITARDLGTRPEERERAPTEQTVELKLGPTKTITMEVRSQ